MNDQTLAADFRKYACEKLQRNLTQIRRCAQLLAPHEVWRRPNENSNAVGNLIIHLTGNVRQWILSGVAGEPDRRDRQAEFDRREPLDVEEITAALQSVIDRAVAIIGALGPDDLASKRTIQGYEVSVQSAVFHVVEHFSWHTGQIVYAAKAIRDVDLSLYDELGRLKDADNGGGP